MTKAGVKCVNSADNRLRPNPGGGGGGGREEFSDIFIHTLARAIFWGVQNFEVQYFLVFSEKLMSFWV